MGSILSDFFTTWKTTGVFVDNYGGNIHQEAAKGNFFKVRRFLKKGANPNAVDLVLDKHKRMDVALVFAIRGTYPGPAGRRHLAIIKLLLKHGANPNYKNKFNQLPIHVACETGDIAIVRLLIDSHSKLNSLDKGGMSPLMIACKEGHKDLIQFLLQENALIDQPIRTFLSLKDHSSVDFASLDVKNILNHHIKERKEKEEKEKEEEKKKEIGEEIKEDIVEEAKGDIVEVIKEEIKEEIGEKTREEIGEETKEEIGEETKEETKEKEIVKESNNDKKEKKEMMKRNEKLKEKKNKEKTNFKSLKNSKKETENKKKENEKERLQEAKKKQLFLEEQQKKNLGKWIKVKPCVWEYEEYQNFVAKETKEKDKKESWNECQNLMQKILMQKNATYITDINVSSNQFKS